MTTPQNLPICGLILCIAAALLACNPEDLIPKGLLPTPDQIAPPDLNDLDDDEWTLPTDDIHIPDLPPDLVADQSHDLPDTQTPANTINLRFDSGTLHFDLDDPAFWIVPQVPSHNVNFRAPVADFLRIETKPQPAPHFIDPMPPMSGPAPRWTVRSYHQVAPGSPFTINLRADSDLAATLEFTPLPSGIHLRINPDRPQPTLRRLALTWTDNGTQLFAGGDLFAGPNARGKRIPLFTDDPRLNPDAKNVGAHYRAFVLNPSGYAIAFATQAPGVFDLAATHPNHLQARFATDQLELSIWFNHDILRALNAYRNDLSLPAPPPPWALAPLVYFDQPTAQTDLLAAANLWSQHRIPIGGLALGEWWQRANNHFDFNPHLLPDAPAFTPALHQRGVALILLAHPYLANEDESQRFPGWSNDTSRFTEAQELGLLMQRGQQDFIVEWQPQRTAAITDLTQSLARDWWTATFPEPTDALGGVLLAFGADVHLRSIDSLGPITAADGTPSSLLPRHLGHLAHRAWRERFSEPVLILSQRVAPHLAGCAWIQPPSHQHEALTQAMSAAINLSLSGQDCFAIDFSRVDADPDLLARIVALQSLMPIMWIPQQALTLLDTAPGRRILRNLTRARMQLSPYLADLQQRREPFIQPLHVRSQSLTASLSDDAFFLGPDLIVYPAVRGEGSTRQVALPIGNWVNWHSAARSPGPLRLTLPYQPDRVPTFARSGAIFPLAFPDLATLANPADPNLIAPQALAHLAYVRTIEQALGSLSLPDGTTLSFTAHPEANQVTILEIQNGTQVQTLFLELFAAYPDAIFCDGLPLPLDEELALTPENPPPTSRRRALPTGHLLLLHQNVRCEIHWP